MARSPARMRLALLSGAAFLPLVLAGQAQAQTICTQAADGAVTCTEGAEVVATGTMTPGTVTTGPGLVVPLTPDPVEGTITGSISTDGPGETAVSLNSDFFVNYVQDGNILATGAGAGGIRVFSFIGTSIAVGDVESNGTGVSVFSPEGDILLTVGDVTTHGDNAAGVIADTEFGMQVSCGDIHTFGDGSTGLRIAGEEGDADVVCGNIITEGNDSTGARFTANQGNTNAQLGDVTTLGDRSDGVQYDHFFGGILTVGNVSTQGIDSDGIYAASVDGPMTLTAGNVSTLGDDSTALEVTTNAPFSFGAGDVSIDVGNVSTSGNNSAAILATATTGTFSEGNLTLVAGDVSTTGDNSPAVVAAGGATATVTVEDVTTSGANSGGIEVTAGAHSLFDDPLGTVNLTCASVTTTGANSTAIRAFSNFEANVTCGDISATGADSDGLILRAEFADVSLGDVTAGGDGIFVGTLDFGSINLEVGDVLVTGNGSIGIGASAHDGGIRINCESVTATGDGSYGLDTSASDGVVVVTCGDIRMEGDGGAGAFLIETGFTLGDVTTLGDSSAGLVMAGVFGLSGTVGDVSTSGAESAGVISVADFTDLTTGSVTTSGDDSIGVFVEGYGADLNLGQVTTTGQDSHGVVVTLFDSSDFDSISLSGVHVSGEGADAVRLQPDRVVSEFDLGIVNPVVTGDIVSEQGTAIFLGYANEFTFSLSEGLEISGRTGGIIATAATTTLDIAGAVRASEGPAIQALGGDATVNIASTGSVSGSLLFGEGDDTVNNAGLFTASGASDFGGGGDLFANSTLFVVNGSTMFAGLETFDNAGGTIDMQDGAPDDRLQLSGDLAGGDGASVLLDVSRSLDAADVLAIGGEVTGETLLAIEWIDSNAPVNAGGVLLVDGVSDPDLFTVSGLEDFGLFALALRARDGDLFLMAAIDPAAADLLLLGAVVPDSWYQSFDALRASIAGRGSLLPRLGFWGQAYGGRDRTGERGTAALFGSEVDASTRLDTERLGLQFGLDGSVGAVLVGATAGYEKADSDAGLTSEIETEGFNVGAYAAIGAAVGPYAMVTVKHDRLDLEFRNAALPVPDLDGTSTGGDVEAGWRGSLGLLAFDINAGLSVVRSDLDGFAIDGTEFDPEDGTSVRGRLGGRVTFAGPLRPFAEARLFQEFGDGSKLNILSGDIEEGLDGADRGTWARLEAGIGGGNDRPLISAYADVGDREGYGLRAGFRF